MKILNKINNYINENEFKIVVTKNYIDIVNYIEILDFNSNRISIKNSDGIIIIVGTNLVISKMVEDEILVTGEFDNVILKGET